MTNSWVNLYHSLIQLSHIFLVYFWLLWLRFWLPLLLGCSVPAPSSYLHFFVHFFLLNLFSAWACHLTTPFTLLSIHSSKISLCLKYQFYGLPIHYPCIYIYEFSMIFYPHLLITISLECYKPETTESHQPTWTSGVAL